MSHFGESSSLSPLIPGPSAPQMVLQSVWALGDMTVQQVIPADYLATLMALFLAIVLDRVCYTLGSLTGKVLPWSLRAAPSNPWPRCWTACATPWPASWAPPWAAPWAASPPPQNGFSESS